MENPKPNKGKTPAPVKQSPAAQTPPSPPPKLPPLFRGVDWLVLVFCFAAIWAAYLFTLAPDLTLEDSGELCTASFYAGIPHPPGYPFWAIYSWFWTWILPMGSVTWRVEVGESFAAAMACGLVGFMVSRGSSMLIEGIEELRGMSRKWEVAICVVCGVTAGLLLGFDNYMWKESVVINRISLFDVPWLMVVALCIMRWIYAPQQRRYLYTAMFFFGLCATIHQTMLVAAMGIEVAVALAHPRYGRSFFLGNSICYLGGLILMNSHAIPALNGLAPTLAILFHGVGIASMAAYVWLAIFTKEDFTDFCRDGALAAVFLFFCAVPGHGSSCLWLSFLALIAFAMLAFNTWRRDLGWAVVIVCGILWVLGVSFYFYEPISGMTVPPMQWGYPRTVEGFFHAISRGQYEKANPTDVLGDPMRFIMQLGLLISGLAGSFSWVFLFVATLPFFFLLKMQKRERAWIIGLAAIYFCVGVLLAILMNTTPDRQTAEESMVFFTASHAVVAIMIGYGLTLLTAYMTTHYAKFRRWGLLGGAVAAGLGLICLWQAVGRHYFGPAGTVNFFEMPRWIIHAFAKDQYSSPIYGNLILAALPLIFILALWLYRQRAPMVITLSLFAAVPVYSCLAHWAKGEERNHWFGYWFGHDMFTPPFEGPDGKFSYDPQLRAQVMKDPAKAKLTYPEMARNAIVFGGTDPGRFCPTYMIFCESFVPPKDKPMDPNFDRRDCYLITQNALADGTYLDYLRSQYNRSQQHDPPFFSRLFRYFACLAGIGDRNRVVMDLNSPDTGKGNSGSALVENVSNLLDKWVDAPLTKFGKRVEDRRRAEGVYPKNEIYIPSSDDSQACFAEYARQKQLTSTDGRIEISGQVDVMNINGLLCKVIFDHNPTNEFYVEESFPLEWMYPYETPFGIIMKINRKPIVTLPDDVFARDHEFWSKYSERLLGNWITYDTTVAQITNFVDKVYLRHDYSGYTGDRKFLRDDDAQKAFSKLRGSQAGMYAWRLHLLEPSPPYPPVDPEYRPYIPKSQHEIDQLEREADFAFKQAFAFCPYSPEAVIRYVNFLIQFQRFDDAMMVAQTCHQLDPYNTQMSTLVSNIADIQQRSALQMAEFQKTTAQLNQMQDEARQHPTNYQNLIMLGGAMLQMQQTNEAIQYFDQALTNPAIPYEAAEQIARYYTEIATQPDKLPKLESVLHQLVVIAPTMPEAHYNYASIEAYLGKQTQALQSLQTALELSAQRLKTNPAANDLLKLARTDPHLNSLRSLPEFQKLVPP